MKNESYVKLLRQLLEELESRRFFYFWIKNTSGLCYLIQFMHPYSANRARKLHAIVMMNPPKRKWGRGYYFRPYRYTKRHQYIKGLIAKYSK